jgi:hypothetical protein
MVVTLEFTLLLILSLQGRRNQWESPLPLWERVKERGKT